MQQKDKKMVPSLYLPFFVASAALLFLVPRNYRETCQRHGLGRTSYGRAHLLGTVLSLLPQFSRWPLLLGPQSRLVIPSQQKEHSQARDRYTYSNQPMSGLKLFLRLLVVVDQRESGAPSTTKVCFEAKGDDTSLVCLVEGSELLGEFGLGDIRSGGVKDIDDELTSSQETVCDEFACANCHWGVGLTGKRREVR